MISSTGFAIISMTGAIVATIVNYLAFKYAEGLWRRYFAITAALALFYVFAWGSLILKVPDLERARWSEVVTPISATTFYTVWMGPAIFTIIGTRKGPRV